MLKLDRKYDYSDVHLVPNESDITSRNQVKLEREFTFRWSKQTKRGVGIIAANMDTVGTHRMADALIQYNMFTALHKHYPPSDILHAFNRQDYRDFVFYTMGVGKAEMQQLGIMAINKQAPDMVCIDIANGHLNILVDTIKAVRQLIPDAIIMAGNVVTGERAVAIIDAGADIVKVGIGGGSACTTRKQTGVGYPQLSAVYECSVAANAVGGLVCADGGCTVPGDIAKAFVAGADFVMLGGMLAGTEESGGHIVLHKKVPKRSVCIQEYAGRETFFFQGSHYYDLQSLPDNAWKTVPLDEPKMLFYGMSSDTAMTKYHNGVSSYRSSEGRTVLIPYKGKVEPVIHDILGGLRSAMSYIGVTDITKAAHAARMVETTNQLNTVFVK